MADHVTAAIEEIMEENVLPPTASLSSSSLSSLAASVGPALLSLLAQVEDQLALHLPPQAQEKVKGVDAWGLDALGRGGGRKGRWREGGRGGREGNWKGWSRKSCCILFLCPYSFASYRTQSGIPHAGAAAVCLLLLLLLLLLSFLLLGGGGGAKQQQAGGRQKRRGKSSDSIRKARLFSRLTTPATDSTSFTRSVTSTTL